MTIGFSDFGADASGIRPPAASDTYDATAETADRLNIK